MDVRALRSWLEGEIEDAKKKGLLLSLHLKATMMKVSAAAENTPARRGSGLAACSRRHRPRLRLRLSPPLLQVSDPVIFGHAVRAFFAPVFEKWAPQLEAAGASPDNGLASGARRCFGR